MLCDLGGTTVQNAGPLGFGKLGVLFLFSVIHPMAFVFLFLCVCLLRWFYQVLGFSKFKSYIAWLRHSIFCCSSQYPTHRISNRYRTIQWC